MPTGTLEMQLVDAKNLKNTDFPLSKMDTYCIIQCRTQEQKSSVAFRQGTNPVWNQIFVFEIDDGAHNVIIRIMDKDRFTSDDFVGETTIPLRAVFEKGSLPPTPYRIVLRDSNYYGQIKVGFKFIPKGIQMSEFGYE